jgi:predicted acyl esterase
VVRLWASSFAIDTDFTAKRLDVYPPSPDSADGFARNLSDSVIRARYRKDRTRAEFLTPEPTRRGGRKPRASAACLSA